MRQLHPDRGGDAGEYLAALAEVDRAFGVPGAVPITAARPRTFVASRVRRVGGPVLRIARAGVLGARARLPRWVPGARRYIDL
jgi:hypothetical protein